MFYSLYATIVLLYNFYGADTFSDVQNSSISKSINITTIIGETIELNCSEYMELQELTPLGFTWFKVEKMSDGDFFFNRMIGTGEMLIITNITMKYGGIYVCNSYNQFQSDHSFYTLTIFGLPKPKIYRMQTYNKTLRVSEILNFTCYAFNFDDRNIEQFSWFKDGKPFLIREGNKRFSLRNRNKEILIKNITFEDKGTYECLASNKFRTDSTKLNLNVIGPSTKMLDNELCAFINTTKHLSENFSWHCRCYYIINHTNVNYTWSKNDKPLKLSENDTRITLFRNNSSLRIENVTFDEAGNYKCFGSNGSFTFTSYRILNVIDYPEKLTYRLFTSNIILITGRTLEFRCNLFQSATNYKTWYSWKRNGKHLILNSNTKIMYYENNLATLKFDKITPNENGTYECEAENYYHKVYSIYTLHVVDPKFPEIYNTSNSTTLVNSGNSLQLYCYVRGVPTPTISWWKNGLPFDIPENNDRITLQEYKQKLSFYFTVSEDGGFYECKVSNKLGSITKEYNISINETRYETVFNHAIQVGANIWLDCDTQDINNKLNNSDQYKYFKWIKNGKPFSVDEINERIFWGENYATLYITNITYEDRGIYICDSHISITREVYSFVYNISVVDKKDSNKNEQTYSIFIFLILFSILLLNGFIMILCCVMFLRREKTLQKELDSVKLKFVNGDMEKWNADFGIEEQTDLLPYDKQWEFPKNKLKLGKKLGSGAFGVVYKADAIGINSKTTSTTVAVKMVKPNSDIRHTKALISELKILIHIGKHLNIVNLLGACTGDITNNLMVIVEFCRFGCIRDYILEQKNGFLNQFTSVSLLKNDKRIIFKYPHYENVPNEINVNNLSVDTQTDIKNDQLLVRNEPSWCSNYLGDYSIENTSPLCTQDLLSWSFQISRGMDYLSSKKILHRDLAIRNILLADENVVKICDFGLAKNMHNYGMYEMKNKVPLPVKWMAIESLREQVFSTKSDVWSFGIVLWELFSLAETPYPDVITYQDLYNRLIHGYRMSQPKYANDQIYSIMYDCWNMNPSSRPSFTELTSHISNLLEESSKAYYANLEEKFVRMNNETSPSTYYESVLSSSNHPSITIKNPDLCSENSERLDINDVIEMKPMVHNQCYS